jgi:prophage regulatory protein
MGTDISEDQLRVRPLRDVARRAGLSLSTLRRLIREGSGPRTVRLSERRLGVVERDFAKWLEARAS